ncbi:molybdopterin converting factor subunit 1 [Paenibacillus thalictri]|uniref:Molybdopterin synthase catalytic subunit n=1 Tax=Paenibacillus thalictri TaxID=2527873 RepID=A0A4Q9DK79_9BACL|nr:molybdopterin converting factor subunit 1 [Paenibacillus thalictri]TBL75091.1 molybdopterin converting factor subunit 1 [Paenibacillus thalictri]
MLIQVHFFAGLAESVGTRLLRIELPDQDMTVSQLKQLMCGQYPGAADKINQAFVAINQAYASEDLLIHQQDEIALIPPVSGGEESGSETGGHAQPMYEITYEAISVDAVTHKVIHPNHGAALTFTGTTREYTFGQRTVRLEYEAYVPMALRTMEQIGEEIHVRWPGTLCAMTHRLGKVDIAEISVVIAVSAPHRADCYEASRYALERLKQIVPIWKKEIWEDGSEWKGHQLGPWNPTAPVDEHKES